MTLLFQNVLVDLSISFLQIKHLNIGGIKKNFIKAYQIKVLMNLYVLNWNKNFIYIDNFHKKRPASSESFFVCKISKLRFNLEAK